MATLHYHRSGEPRRLTVTRRNECRLSAAVDRLAKHGFTDVIARQHDRAADPMVVVIQDFWPRGDEVAVCLKTRGRYRGQSVATVIRGREGR